MAGVPVLVLGAEGMLGQAVFCYLASLGWNVSGTQHTRPDQPWFLEAAAEPAAWRSILAEKPFQYAINCIGILKNHMLEGDSNSLRQAIQINALFPHVLAQEAAGLKIRVIHISTDGVFSPGRGSLHSEADPPDCTDHYGRSKALGECPAANAMNIRCSIVGRNPIRRRGLLEWFLRQPDGGEIAGFEDQLWNGVTTLQFAQLCERLMTGEVFENARRISSVHHFCPNPVVSKYQLLCNWGMAAGKRVTVTPTSGHAAGSRRLSTKYNLFQTLSAPAAWPDILDELLRLRLTNE